MVRNLPMIQALHFGKRQRLQIVSAFVAMATLVCTATSHGAIMVDNSASVTITGAPSSTFGEISNFTVGNNTGGYAPGGYRGRNI
jgi:hypothetical protein